MSLLHDIQSAVIQENSDIAPILLKLRLLAARLQSAPLQEWVKHESEGYPDDATVPDYRKVGVSYTGTFTGPFNSGIKNAPIAPYLIGKFAGEQWNDREIRQGISEVDDLVKSASSGSLQLNAANLILLLQGKVYPDYACNSVDGTIARASLVGIQHAVRNRILELTIELEAIPGAADITFNNRLPPVADSSERATQITNQVIYGGTVTTISSSGTGAVFNLAIQAGDQGSLVDALVGSGIPKSDAVEFGQIVATEKPESKEEPFGVKAKAWVLKNLQKAASGSWKMGIAVATEVLKQAALKFYDLK